MSMSISLFQIECKVQYLITTWEMLTEGCWDIEVAQKLGHFAADFRREVRPLCFCELSNELDRLCLVLNELCTRRCAPTPVQRLFASLCLDRLRELSAGRIEFPAHHT